MENKEIYIELNRIQQELKAPKGQTNKFGNYNYRSCEDILEAVKKILGESILTITDDIICIGDRVYVKSTATISLFGQSIFTSAMAREPLDRKGMDQSQITGAASSYARKYALNGLFCIDDTKDADTQNNNGLDNKKLDDTKDADKKEWLTPNDKKLWPHAIKQLSEGKTTIEEIKQKVNLRPEHEKQLKEQIKEVV